MADRYLHGSTQIDSLTTGSNQLNLPTNSGTLALTTQIPDVSSMNKEAYLTWGGKNFHNVGSAFDSVINPYLSANRFASSDPTAIVCEYTNDGTTWANYWDEAASTTAGRKKSIVTTQATSQFRIGGPDASAIITANSKIRFTLDAITTSIYTRIQKIQIYASLNNSNGGSVKVETKKYFADGAAEPDWVTIVENQAISGWPGWAILNDIYFIFGGTSASNIRKIRFTFSHTSISAGYETGNLNYGLQIKSIYAYGGVGWSEPSWLSYQGTPYKYNENGDMHVMGYLAPKTSSSADIGTSTYKWKDIWFTGSLKDGTNSLTVAQIEKNTNKVTSITSSSTDTQYPSAKAVYDYIESLDGDDISY